MPVKIKTSAVTTKSAAVNQDAPLDASVLKLIAELSIPLAKAAKAEKLAAESLEKSTFKLYADFRATARKHFGDDPQKANKKAIRALASNVLATVYDIPLGALKGVDGANRDAWVYPDEYVNAKGVKVDHPKAGQEVDAAKVAKMTEEQKKLLVHPVVPRAASMYQKCTKLVKITVPDSATAKALVDKALTKDGVCQCTEPQLYMLATGSLAEIPQKGTQGGARNAIVWDAAKLTESMVALMRKAWNGDDIVAGAKGELDLEELSAIQLAALAMLEAERDKATKAQKAVLKKGKAKAKAEPEDEEEEEEEEEE